MHYWLKTQILLNSRFVCLFSRIQLQQDLTGFHRPPRIYYLLILYIILHPADLNILPQTHLLLSNPSMYPRLSAFILMELFLSFSPCLALLGRDLLTCEALLTRSKQTNPWLHQWHKFDRGSILSIKKNPHIKKKKKRKKKWMVPVLPT